MGAQRGIVAHLADALIGLGHEVTLFASADAQTAAKLIPVRDQALRLDPAPLKSDLAAHFSMLHEVHRRAHEFDMIHFHVDLIHFPFFEDITQRTGLYLARPIGLEPIWRRFTGAGHFYPLVSISQYQRGALPLANWVWTVPHGVSKDLFRSAPNPRTTSPFSGASRQLNDLYLAIATRKGWGLNLGSPAKVDAADKEYFTQMIEPLLSDPLIEFIGEIGDAEKSAFLGQAIALLFPIDWPEAFLACDDRGYGMWHSGCRLALRLRAGGYRRRGDRVHRRFGG